MILNYTKTDARVRKIVLVIEDERPLVKVIGDRLEKIGFDIVTARTVDQGLTYMMEVNGISAVWLDHYLVGEQTGIDFVRKIKCFDKWKDLPIFIVSNTASSSNVSTYLELGVTNYSVKSDHKLDQITYDLKSFLNHEKIKTKNN